LESHEMWCMGTDSSAVDGVWIEGEVPAAKVDVPTDSLFTAVFCLESAEAEDYGDGKVNVP
jgi:hypothetical protein